MFAVPAGPLAPALVAFGRQAGLQVSYVPERAQGAVTPGVRGTLEPDAALARLLAGTGLGFRYGSARTVVIEAAPYGPAGEVVLGTLTVDGSTPDGTWGFVATRATSASKTDTSLVEIPQSISVITREELDTRRVFSDSEALTYVPGVLAQPFGGIQHQQNPFFYIRGFPTSFGGSYVDGLISFVNYRYEPWGYDRYEVVRGPASTLFGQGDPGGIVNRITKLPTGERTGEIQVQGGNYDRLQVAYDTAGPLDADGTVLYRVAGLYRNADAPIDYDRGQTGPDERTFVAPAVTWKPTERTSLTLLAHYLEDTVGQENSYRRPDTGGLTRIPLAQLGLAEWEQEQYSAGYLLDHRFSDDVAFHQALRWSRMESTMLGVYQGESSADGRTVGRITDGNDEWRRDFVVDSRLDVRFATGPAEHRAMLGFEFQRTTDWIAFTSGAAPDLDLTAPDYGQFFPSAAAWLQNRYEGWNYAVYAQDQVTLAGGPVLTVSGRQDWNRTTNDDQIGGAPLARARDAEFTWRVGASWPTSIGLAPYAAYATSFLPQSGTDITGRAFRPTTGRQVELGVKYQPTTWNGLITAAVFDLRKRNVPSPDTQNLAVCPWCQVQTGEVRSRGVELQATASFDAVNLNAAYTWTDVEVTRDNPDVAGASFIGKRPVLTPAHMVSLWLDYTFDRAVLGGPRLGAGVRRVGASWGDQPNTLRNDAYTLVDAMLRYDLGVLSPDLAGAEASINVTNLLGNAYVTCYSPFDCKWGAPRIVYGTLAWHW